MSLGLDEPSREGRGVALLGVRARVEAVDAERVEGGGGADAFDQCLSWPDVPTCEPSPAPSPAPTANVVKVGDLRTTTSDVPRARYAAERNYTAHSWWWTGGGLCPPPCCSSALRTALRSREPTLPVRGFFGFG